MTEMIERVAKALFLHETKAAREEFPGPDGWDTMLSEAGRNGWRKAAKVVIEAMREPTDHMRSSAYSECGTTDLADPKDFKDHYGNVWETMIDAALTDVPLKS